MNSSAIDSIITTKLREDALDLRRLATKSPPGRSTSSLSSIKQGMVRDIHRILVLTLGAPPSPLEAFTWEYYDQDDKFQVRKVTPVAFAKELSCSEGVKACGGTDVNKLFSLVNDPRNSYGRLLSVSRLGNVVGGRGVRYVNVDMTVGRRCLPRINAAI